jgi:hypothetical protein
MHEQSLGAAAGEIFNPRTVWPPVCRLLYAGEVDVLDLLRDSMRRNKQPRNKAMTMIRFVVFDVTRSDYSKFEKPPAWPFS